MTRDEQEQRRRDARNECQRTYWGTDEDFPRARCKLQTGHDGKHMCWRRSLGRYIEWEEPVHLIVRQEFSY